MRFIRPLLFVLLFALPICAPPVWATSYSTDQSDLWFIPAESGWGIQFVQRGNLIFATMFVYDAAGNPIWYVATMAPTGGSFGWSGDMYLTHGTSFSAAWNPSLFTGRIVGTMTWAPQTVTNGLLSYTVDTIAVTKAIVRQSLVADDFTGHYAGGLHETFTNCTTPANNGTFESTGPLILQQNGNSLSMTTTPAAGVSCSYAGQMSQLGQMGGADGNYSCTNGNSGSFSLFEMQINVIGVTGRINEQSSTTACMGTGWFGGVHTTL
jgi:hypothetical protein